MPDFLICFIFHLSPALPPPLTYLLFFIFINVFIYLFNFLSLSFCISCPRDLTHSQHVECLFPEPQLLLFLDYYWLSQSFRPCLKSVSVDLVCDGRPQTRCGSPLTWSLAPSASLTFSSWALSELFILVTIDICPLFLLLKLVFKTCWS